MMKNEAELRALLDDMDLVLASRRAYESDEPAAVYSRGLREGLAYALGTSTAGDNPENDAAREIGFNTLRRKAQEIRTARRAARQ